MDEKLLERIQDVCRFMNVFRIPISISAHSAHLYFNSTIPALKFTIINDH